MTRERIEDFREIVLPFLSRTLLKTNYENMGKSDAEEFEKDFNEILDLAIQALEQEPILDKIRAEIMDFEEELFHRPNTDYTDYAAVRHCVEIIDKYKAESEDNE